ncbi:MAG: radical SAM protein [Candidatus Omnitrophota bacterium]
MDKPFHKKQTGRGSRDVLRLAGALKDRVFVGPQVVHLYITDKCNLSCKYCRYHGRLKDLRRPTEMSFSKIRAIVDDAAAMGVDAIYLSGEGEPTAHSRFRDIIDHITRKGLSVALFTNATFRRELVPYVLRAAKLVINLPSVDQATYGALQVRASSKRPAVFRRVLENIQSIALSRNADSLASPTLQFLVVLNKLNFRQAREVSKFAARQGGRVIFHRMSLHRNNQKIAIGANLGAGDASRGQDLRGDLFLAQAVPGPRAKKVPANPKPCFVGWYYAFITLDGKVSLCCNLNRLEIGNIYEDSFKDIWFSGKFMDYRKKAKYRRFFKECRGGCGFSKRNIEISHLYAGFKGRVSS